jgi:transcriptional regulator GlxA family with amidase domain
MLESNRLQDTSGLCQKPAETATHTMKTRPINVALLATPAVTASTLYGFVDILAGTRRDWGLMHGDLDAASPFQPIVVSVDGAPFVAVNGVRIVPDAKLDDMRHCDVAVVTDLHIEPGASLAALDRENEWLHAVYANGGTLASSCSGAALLAATGLLDNEDATSHWAYCDALARKHTKTRWHPDRKLVVAGRDGRILMGGSGLAWHMLVLVLIARYSSPEDAMQVARINLIDLSETSPLAYSSLTRGSRADDPLIARCQIWAADNYHIDAPVAQMAELSGLAERTFKRRFQLATGMTPLTYVHTVRLEEAKHLLESSELSIDAVANEVGYQDAGFFSRLFRRKVALSPAQYRRRFGALDRKLRAEAQVALASGSSKAESR